LRVDVQFPEELLQILKLNRDEFKRRVLLYTLGKLYEEGQISGRLAASIIGCNLLEFYKMLSEHGFNVIDYPEDELEEEAEAIR